MLFFSERNKKNMLFVLTLRKIIIFFAFWFRFFECRVFRMIFWSLDCMRVKHFDQKLAEVNFKTRKNPCSNSFRFNFSVPSCINQKLLPLRIPINSNWLISRKLHKKSLRDFEPRNKKSTPSTKPTVFSRKLLTWGEFKLTCLNML